MREHQANIRIDKELWTEFKTKAQQQGSNGTAEIIKFIEAYVQNDENSIKTYPDVYIESEVKQAIETNLDGQFNQAVNDFEKILKHEIEKQYSELHQMYEHRLREIENQLGIDFDSFDLTTYYASPNSETETIKDSPEHSRDRSEILDILKEENTECTDSIFRTDDIDKIDNIDRIDHIDGGNDTEKNRETILISDKQLKKQESLDQHPSTIGRWRKGQSKMPSDLLPILEKYEIIGTKWARKESA